MLIPLRDMHALPSVQVLSLDKARWREASQLPACRAAHAAAGALCRLGLLDPSASCLTRLQNLQSAAAAEAAAAAAEYQRKAAGTPTRAHRRGASVDFGQSKEDLLDNIFSSYQGGRAAGAVGGAGAGAGCGRRPACVGE